MSDYQEYMYARASEDLARAKLELARKDLRVSQIERRLAQLISQHDPGWAIIQEAFGIGVNTPEYQKHRAVLIGVANLVVHGRITNDLVDLLGDSVRRAELDR